MTAKRILSVIVAIAMIAGAWIVRTRVLDDETAAPDATRTGDVVCITDLAAVCREVASELGISVRIESVDTTLAAWGSKAAVPGEVWVTMAPFPAMVDSLRSVARLDPIESTSDTIASSPLTVVANAPIADDLAIACGDPIDWFCLGTSATARVGFSPFPSTATGQLGVTAAVLGVGGGAIPPQDDTSFIAWARQISGGANNSRSAGTAISTIQTRTSAFDVAVGPAAELVDPDDPRFVRLAPEGAPTIEVVVAVPSGTRAPGGFVDALAPALAATGWSRSGTAGPALSPDAMLAVREIWKGFS